MAHSDALGEYGISWVVTASGPMHTGFVVELHTDDADEPVATFDIVVGRRRAVMRRRFMPAQLAATRRAIVMGQNRSLDATVAVVTDHQAVDLAWFEEMHRCAERLARWHGAATLFVLAVDTSGDVDPDIVAQALANNQYVYAYEYEAYETNRIYYMRKELYAAPGAAPQPDAVW